MSFYSTHASRRSISALIVCAGMMLLSTSAIAAPLVPGGTVAPTPTPSPAGATLIADTGLVPFASVDATSFTGTLQSQVFIGDPSNPFGLAGLTFAFRLSNDLLSPDSLERLVTINYDGYLTDANFSASAPPGAIPTAVDRSANGKVVGWDYTGGLGIVPGTSSSLLVLHTNASAHVSVINSIINGSVATVASFGPAPIPEPASLALAGIAGLGLLARRRSN